MDGFTDTRQGPDRRVIDITLITKHTDSGAQTARYRFREQTHRHNGGNNLIYLFLGGMMVHNDEH